MRYTGMDVYNESRSLQRLAGRPIVHEEGGGGELENLNYLKATIFVNSSRINLDYTQWDSLIL